MIALLLSSAAAIAVPATTTQCVTVSPVSTSVNLEALQKDADCFGAAAASDRAGRDVLSNAAASAAASQKLRLDRIAYVKAHPPVTPPVVLPPVDCGNGITAPAGQVCPPPPPPPPVDCGGGVTVPAGQTCPIPPPPPPPPPTPPPTNTISLPNGVESDTIFGLAYVPSPSDMKGVSGTPRATPSANTNAPDNVGAFRFICGAGDLRRDDPIMFPGQPGRSHGHQFYGLLNVTANDTYDSLRKSTAPSTCQTGSAFVDNKSAYWMPWLEDGKGNVIRPDYVSIYYKRRPLSDPACQASNPNRVGICLPMPNGLRYIFGRDMTNLSAPSTGAFHFICQTQQGGYPPLGNGPNNNGLGYKNMEDALAVCGPGLVLGAIIDAPSCWDGKNLDYADHRSHMADAKFTSLGLTCPRTHPYVIPSFTLGARWTIMQGDDTTLWQFSSDPMRLPGEKKGSTFHADWFGAWSNQALKIWVENCIDKLLSCQSGNLGQGQGLIGAYAPANGFNAPANPRLVPIGSIQ